jgi:DNA-binding transcriptional LysR family regulator
VDSFDNMRVFAKVVESGSFTGAAARLSISASMVSQHVKELEPRCTVWPCCMDRSFGGEEWML